MHFSSTKDGKKYTISIEGSKLTTILVENQSNGHRKLYQREPSQCGLTIDENIFEEAILGVCQNCEQMWVFIYEVLEQDMEYGQKQMREILEKYYK